MKKVVVIGKNGLVGSKLIEKMQNRFDVIGLDKTELNTKEFDACLSMITTHSPDIIINATGFLNADRCEEFYEESYSVNTGGVANLVKAIKESKKDICFIHFSSDFVFDGEKGNYVEEDIPNPINIYGIHKWLADEIIKNSGLQKYYIFRIASVIGFNVKGNNFLKAILPIAAKRKEISIVNDITVNLTTTDFISHVVVEAIEREIPYGLFNCVTNGITSWFDIAKFAIEYLALDVNLKPISKEEYNYKAKRSTDSTLNNMKLNKYIANVPLWYVALEDHLKLYKEKYLEVVGAKLNEK